jgi:hypothetical protein
LREISQEIDNLKEDPEANQYISYDLNRPEVNVETNGMKSHA